MATAKNPDESGRDERQHGNHFPSIGILAIIILQLFMIFLLLARTPQQPVAAQAAPPSDFFRSLTGLLVGGQAAAGGGSSAGQPCTVTEAGGDTVIVVRNGTRAADGTTTVVTFHNNTQTTIVFNNTIYQNGSGEAGTPGGSPYGECYTMTICPSGQPNATQCGEPEPSPGDSCQPSGGWCGEHPNAPPGASCCGGLSCQSGYCLPETGSCGAWGEYCSLDSDCCYGYSCMNGYCSPPPQACSTSGACSSDSDCCTGLSCENGYCSPPITPQNASQCRGISEICAAASDCCSGYSCSGGLCQPAAQACADTDGGQVFEVQGNATGTYLGAYGVHSDYCRVLDLGDGSSVTNLVEYYCSGNGSEVRAAGKQCLGGCADGRCLPETAQACTDSDGGREPSARGTARGAINGFPNNYTDRCYSGTTLIEYYCTGNGFAANSSFEPCRFGCAEGACLPEPACSDTDGGNDTYAYGTATGRRDAANPQSFGSFPDSCASSILTEYYCSNNTVRDFSASCQNGCSNGACLAQACQPSGGWCGDHPSAPPGAVCCAGLACQGGYCFPPPAEPGPQFCNDTDGGINYNVFGTVTTNDYVLNDTCSGPTLYEYYCLGSGSTFSSNAHTCPSGCSNGACAG